MRLERVLVGLFCIAAVTSAGCGGQLAYNLPPASRLMEPGPGVGGPGPGVIPPAGSPYGLYGGAVGRFGGQGGGGTYIGGDYGYGGECATNQAGPMGNNRPMMAANVPPANSGVMQAGFDGGYGCGDACGDGSCGIGDGGCGAGGCGAGGCGDGGYGAGACMDGCYDGACGYGGPCSCGGAGCPLCGGLRGLLHGHGHGHRHGLGFGGLGSSEAGADGGMMGPATSQVAFLGEEGVQISWDVSGSGLFDSTALVIPGRQDFYQGAIYRLKLTNLPGRPGVELYPTLEIAPVTPRTDAYLAHSPIPVQFTEEDFDQVLSGNFVTKVIYLPDPEFQELALAGVETLVSTRLDPGVDPIAEADRRGSILAILRMGNKDLEGGSGANIQTEQVVPLNYVTQSSHNGDPSYADQAIYDQETNAAGEPMRGPVTPAQYCGDGEYYGGGGGGYCGPGMDGNMPMGMPTGGGMGGGGFMGGGGPPAMPPNYMAGAPQWGMPITGTPIGLPGPPHVPLGVPAGLQKHVMKNRTRILMPPPVAKVQVSVKQRPGLNYPRPVNHVHIDETQREPLRLIPSWFPSFFHHHHGGHGAHGGGAYGQECQ